MKKSYDSKLDNEIISIFKKSRNNYSTRKIRKELNKKGYKDLGVKDLAVVSNKDKYKNTNKSPKMKKLIKKYEKITKTNIKKK
ncbi:hypothetical protein FQB35_12115 [Crassaminicella thermophila]|uniref:HTH-like domain-containing protein n=1 Tax=Crassaminicella thermophila TaxID=2599308 RepID=A0A5C0SEF4_CRATE|nr:hypothetical protein FQB35_12115 [Crassaminicella thermophila]